MRSTITSVPRDRLKEPVKCSEGWSKFRYIVTSDSPHTIGEVPMRTWRVSVSAFTSYVVGADQKVTKMARTTAMAIAIFLSTLGLKTLFMEWQSETSLPAVATRSGIGGQRN